MAKTTLVTIHQVGLCVLAVVSMSSAMGIALGALSVSRRLWEAGGIAGLTTGAVVVDDEGDGLTSNTRSGSRAVTKVSVCVFHQGISISGSTVLPDFDGISAIFCCLMPITPLASVLSSRFG